MHIDIFTFIAQLINFVILAILLEKLLLSRIKTAIAIKEKKMAEEAESFRLRSAALDAREKALNEREAYIKEGAETIFKETHAKAGLLREELLLKAKEEVSYLKKGWAKKARDELLDYKSEITKLFIKNSAVLAYNSVKDLSGKDLEEMIIMKILGMLQSKEADALRHAVVETGSAYFVTANTLSDRQRDIVIKGINDIAGKSTQIHFSVDKTLLCGAEIVSSGKYIAWNLGSYAKSYISEIERKLENG